MNKADLIAAIAEKAKVMQQDVEPIFLATFDIIAELLVAKEKITIPGFGNFSTKTRGERKGRNPATKQEMIIPKADVVNFKPATQLKNKVNHENTTESVI